MKNITVFCSAVHVSDEYMQAGIELSQLIAKNGYSLVWGGSNVGLMKVIADTAQEAGAKIIGISIPRFISVMREHVDEKIIAKDLCDRKRLLIEHGDAIIGIAGVIGTLDEIMETIELKKQGAHSKPVIIVNTDHFYDGLKLQLQTMESGGFFPMSLNDLVYFVQSPQEAFEYLTSLQ